MFAQEGTEDLARAVAMVEREKVVAASAAAEATLSAAKAGDILTEMLGSFSTEMSNARRKSLQLQVRRHLIGRVMLYECGPCISFQIYELHVMQA